MPTKDEIKAASTAPFQKLTTYFCNACKRVFSLYYRPLRCTCGSQEIVEQQSVFPARTTK